MKFEIDKTWNAVPNTRVMWYPVSSVMWYSFPKMIWWYTASHVVHMWCTCDSCIFYMWFSKEAQAKVRLGTNTYSMYWLTCVHAYLCTNLLMHRLNVQTLLCTDLFMYRLIYVQTSCCLRSFLKSFILHFLLA